MDQIPNFAGVFNGDINASANTYVKRDANGAGAFAGLAIGGNGLSNSGPMTAPGAVVSGNTTLTNASPRNLEVDATSGNVTLTLPPMTTSAGQEFSLVKTDSSGHSAFFKGNASETINGNNTQGTATQYGTLRIRCNVGATGWLLG